MAASAPRFARALLLRLAAGRDAARRFPGRPGRRLVRGGFGRSGFPAFVFCRGSLGRVGLGVGLGLSLGFGLGLFLLGAGQVALVFLVRLEVGLVPAGSLEPEHGRGHQLAQAILAAARAFFQWFVSDLLQHLFTVTAVWAFVLVERHLFHRRNKIGRAHV